MARETVRVEGLRELVRDFGRIDADLRRQLQREISEAADIVAQDARSRADRYAGNPGGKIRPRVRGASGYVESRARSKGIRPDFGALLMRTAFLPALASKESEVTRRVDQMLDRLAGSYQF